MNQAIETALEALKVAIEAGEVEAGNKAVEEYKASQPTQPPQTQPSEPAEGSSGEAEPPATATYSQQDLDNAVAAQRQADQAKVESVTALLDASNAKIESLKADVKELGDDVAKAAKDAE